VDERGDPRSGERSYVGFENPLAQPRLPAELRARVEESTIIQFEYDSRRSVYPDARVVEEQEFDDSSGGVAVATFDPLPLRE